MKRERLSALADGELQGEEFVQAIDYAGTDEGRDTWQVYHLIGEALRCSEPVAVSDSALLDRLRVELAREPLPMSTLLAPAAVVQVAPPAAEPARDAAANASVFRWKLVAGFASIAAVAVLGWNAYVGLGANGGNPAAEMAAVQPAPAAPQQTLVATSNGADEPQVMIRDPRLDELLAAHKQFGSTSALQMPAGFLRNATFEGPAR